MKVPEIFIGKRKIVKRNVLQLKKSFSTTNSLVSLFEELPNVLITDEILIACDDISNYRENENVLRLYEVSELFVFFCDFMKQKGQEVKKTLEDFYQEVYKSDWLFLLYLNQIDGIQVWKHNDYFRYLRLLEEKWIEISHLNFIDDRTPKSQNIQNLFRFKQYILKASNFTISEIEAFLIQDEGFKSMMRILDTETCGT